MTIELNSQSQEPVIDITPDTTDTSSDNSSDNNNSQFYFSIPKSQKGGWNPNYTNEDAVVVFTEGGIGDNVCHLPMIYQVRQLHPNSKLVLVPSHHEPFLNIDFIDEVWNRPEQNDLDGSIYELYLSKSVPVYRASSLYGYLEWSTHFDKRHLCETICDLARVDYLGKDKIELQLSPREQIRAKRILQSFLPFNNIILLQTNSSNYAHPGNSINLNKDWFKEYWEETITNLAVHLNKTNQIYKFLHVGLPQEEPLFNTISTTQLTNNIGDYKYVFPNGSTYYNLLGNYDLRTIISLVAYCDTFINIDSLLNHIGYGFRTKGVVLFGRTDPNIFGHEDFHLNIINTKSCETLFCQRAKGATGDTVLIDGQVQTWICPHRKCMQSIRPDVVSAVTLQAIEYNKTNPNKYKKVFDNELKEMLQGSIPE